MKLSDAVTLLRNAGIDSATYDAREIFMRIGNLQRNEILLGNPETFDENIISAVFRRQKREPLQYIIGEVGFYKETYKVSADCLIPREDTEILVDYAVKNLPCGARFIDVCTGSGCIAISTLKHTSDTSAVAIDISSAALKIAKENAELNGVSDRISFLESDVLSESVDEKVFAVLSNPPYVTEKAYLELEDEIYFEPKVAFVGGEDGLVFYKKILDIFKDKIDKNGFFAFEIGYDQAEAVRSIAEKRGLKTEILKDLSANDRVAVIRP